MNNFLCVFRIASGYILAGNFFYHDNSHYWIEAHFKSKNHLYLYKKEDFEGQEDKLVFGKFKIE